MLKQAIEKLATDLRADLGATAGIGHAPTKGDLREDSLREGLARHMPSQYEFAKGVVVDSSDNQSLSQDILVVDRQVAGPFVGEAIFPIEAVKGAIQVKSNLDPAEVPDAVQNVVSVAQLVPEEHRLTVIDDHQRSGHQFDDIHQVPFTGVFAYGTSSSPEKLATAFAEANLEREVHERAAAMCLLDVGVVIWGYEIEDAPATLAPEARVVWFASPSRHAQPLWIETGELALSVFVWSLWEALLEYEPPRLSPFVYLRGPDIVQGRFWVDEE